MCIVEATMSVGTLLQQLQGTNTLFYIIQLLSLSYTSREKPIYLLFYSFKVQLDSTLKIEKYYPTMF